jgi:hypothetical protein
VSERLVMSLYNAQQAHQAIQTAWHHAKGWLAAGDTRLTLEIRPEKRSDAQNRLLHSVLQDIAQQVDWHGKKFDVVTWKRLCMAAWLREAGGNPELIPALDGSGFDVIYERTSKLNKTQCSELIEWCFAFGADHGVKFRGMEDDT